MWKDRTSNLCPEFVCALIIIAVDYGFRLARKVDWGASQMSATIPKSMIVGYWAAFGDQSS